MISLLSEKLIIFLEKSIACFPMKCRCIGAMLSGPSTLLFLRDLDVSSTIFVETLNSSSCIILRKTGLFVFGEGWIVGWTVYKFFSVLRIGSSSTSMGVILGVLAVVIDSPLTVDQSLFFTPQLSTFPRKTIHLAFLLQLSNLVYLFWRIHARLFEIFPFLWKFKSFCWKIGSYLFKPSVRYISKSHAAIKFPKNFFASHGWFGQWYFSFKRLFRSQFEKFSSSLP